MSAEEWLTYLTLALCLGAAGQVVRVGVGIKKMYDKNPAGIRSVFDLKKFLTSIALGALAAVITAIIKWDATGQSLEMHPRKLVVGRGH